MDRVLEPPVDGAAGAQPLDQDEVGAGRLARQQGQQVRERRADADDPFLAFDAALGHAFAQALDVRVVGGQEAGVLAGEMAVEIALRDVGAFADHGHRRTVVTALVQSAGHGRDQTFPLVVRDELL